MKHCHACDQTLPYTEFYKDSSKRDGLNAYCKACVKRRGAIFTKRSRPRVSAPEGFKHCRKCQTTKPVSEFNRNRRHFDDLNPDCKPCQLARRRKWVAENPERVKELMRNWHHANPKRSKEIADKARYGLEYGEYDRILALQDGRCALCRTDKPGGKGRFHVDHDHATGKVRGLLCHNCNVALGHVNEDPVLIRKMIAYLAEG